jgi:hypothetical protein
MLGGPLTALILAICAGQLVCWIPHYLTWPWWSDHDVFATLAQGWSEGRLPYRDLRANNFPGTIYLFWAIGKIAGWGQTAPLYAFDAALLVSLGAALLAWSRAVFRRLLPGASAYAGFLTFYLGLTYTLAAQRDWHASLFGVLGILAAQAIPKATGRFASGLALGVAFGLRPQAVLFCAPALAAVLLAADRTGWLPHRAIAEWGGAALLGVGLMFAPILAAGLTRDILVALQTVAAGSSYNKLSPSTFLAEFLRQLATRDFIVLTCLGLLASRVNRGARRVAATWIVAWITVSLYRPISPQAHAYLLIPITLVGCVVLGILVEFLKDAAIHGDRVRLASSVLALGMFVVIKPPMVNPISAARAIQWLARRQDPIVPPLGYRENPGVLLAAYYPWDDYRALLAYLREHVRPQTRVANGLLGAPAVTGPVGRLPAFPAESIAWLFMVAPEDEPAFARYLEGAEDSVVVWAPSEIGFNRRLQTRFEIPGIEPVIRRYYQFEARFGAIEVWRRKTSASAGRRLRFTPSPLAELRSCDSNRVRGRASPYRRTGDVWPLTLRLPADPSPAGGACPSAVASSDIG